MSSPIAVLLNVSDALVASHPQLYGGEPSGRASRLAEALATSPAWRRLRRNASLVVRGDAGIIGILGTVHAEHQALIGALGRQVPDLLRRLLPVSYGEAEAATLKLAARVRSVLSEEELGQCGVRPIPRGGLVVAGLLSYALGIGRTRLEATPGKRGSRAITLLVDDCALSGARLRQELANIQEGEIVVALLHAHPELCRRVEELERVRACLIGEELDDHAPRRSDYASWKQRWAERAPLDYWTGDPDHLAYPWNEPDVLIWNPALRRAEGGWRVVPPEWCIKNRADHVPGDVQHCAPVRGELMPADDVVWARRAGGWLIAKPGLERALALDGAGDVIWQAIIEQGSEDAAAAAVSRAYRVEREIARADVERLVGALDARGLLRRGQQGHGQA